MKKIFLYFILTLSFIGQAYADLQDASDAFDKGDFETAVQEWKPLAKDGNAEAQYRLGRAYYFGDGIAKNEKLAFEWTLKSAEKGFAKGQHIVGLFYQDGIGVDVDLERAYRWYKKGAKQGHIGSQVLLSYMYALGDGVETNPKFAYYWMMKAANQGDACAHWHIAYMYAEGIYPKQDINQTYFWGKQAVDKGCELAVVELKKITDYLGDNLPKIQPISYRINFDEIPKQEIHLINKANLNGDKKYKLSSLENLTCKSYILATKGGSINIKKKASKKSNRVSSYSDGYTEETNQRYFDLKSKIRNAKYELEDNDNISSGGGGSNALAFFTGVAIQLRHNQIRDEINALENELRRTKPTVRRENIVSYSITQDSVAFEKTQKAKWMLINCDTGEVEINQLDASNTLKMSLYSGLRSDDLKNFASQNQTSKNKLKTWSELPILSMADIIGQKNKLLSSKTTKIDSDSISSLVKSFLYNE